MSMTDTTNEAPRGGAAANLAALKDRAGKVSGAFDRKQRTVMAAVFAATIGAVLAFSFLGSRTDWAPLMTNLAADAMTGIPPRLPPELEGMIGLQGPGRTPNADGAPAAEARYVIRMVWTSPPCRPVLSEPTRAFELARAMDADAPARPILIQMPDINNLRQFNRGVAIEMPPSLRKVLTQVTPKILKEEGLDQGLEVQLGKICSLSLQIIMLVAFIVMFIFLILLNIVFWWLPFLKICFPVPMPASTTKGPKP